MTAAPHTSPNAAAQGDGQRGTPLPGRGWQRGFRQCRGGGHPAREGWGAWGQGGLGNPSPSPKPALTSLEGGLISINRTENRMFGPRALLPMPPPPPPSCLSYFEGLIFAALMKATAVQGWYLGLSVRILMAGARALTLCEASQRPETGCCRRRAHPRWSLVSPEPRPGLGVGW